MFCIYLFVYMLMLVFVLDLYSTYERKHVTFVFLNLAYFTSHDPLHPFTCEEQNFPLYGWIIFHRIYHLNPFSILFSFSLVAIQMSVICTIENTLFNSKNKLIAW
jgi:hypothetical protein